MNIINNRQFRASLYIQHNKKSIISKNKKEIRYIRLEQTKCS